MKTPKFILGLAALAFAATAAEAHFVESLNIDAIDLNRTGGNMQLVMNVSPRSYKLGTNTEWTITPTIVSRDGTRSATFEPYIVTGRNAYYYTQRRLDGADIPVMRAGKGEDVGYTSTIPYQSWMEQSVLEFVTEKTSCCGSDPKAKAKTETLPVADINFMPLAYAPDFNYVTPARQSVKERNLSGRAYINFVVNRTDIDPGYMNNQKELDKILSSIDSVRYNRDATVDTIRLTGYASPEGPYENNVRLAHGRTVAVMNYVKSVYDFPARVYKTAYVPEDWAGLLEYIKSSDLEEKDAMAAFIEDPAVPVEKKNEQFQARFPKIYPWLLENEYPKLRHTDYYIHYVIKQYATVDEIKAAMKRDPRNLSLNEFFLAANSYPQDSPEFEGIIMQAVALYPNDPTANLNAANVQMKNGNYDLAKKLVYKAGDTPEAEYTRGLLAALQKDYDSASLHLNKAKAGGLTKAADALDQIYNITNTPTGVTFRE